MNDFLPEGYEAPKSESRYMKFEEGANYFRTLSSAIVGWEWWVDDGEGGRMPKRVKNYEDVPDEVKNASDSRKRARHFWAFAVYNLKEKQVQILEITQKTIMKQLTALISDKAWGNPKEYSIMITKTKTGSRDLDVEYSTMPRPKKAVPKEVLKEYASLHVDLEALYKGEDPFGNAAKEELEPEPEKGTEEVRPEDIPF